MKTQVPMCFSFSTAAEARQTVVRLLRRHVSPRDIEVISPEPIHEIDALIVAKSRLPFFVIAGAFLGIIAGFLLASVTARLYPIHTGGMPILSFLPIGIVTYESMMLLAVVFSLGGLILEARLLRRTTFGFRPHAKPIREGEILVLVRGAVDVAPDDPLDTIYP